MRTARALVAALVALLPAVAGCPSNFCLLTVNGRCELSSCSSGEHYDNQQKRCACDAGRVSLGGSCLTPQEANAHCGRGAVWTPQGCAAPTCPPGFLPDFTIEQCVPKSAIDKAAGVGAGQTLACAAGTVLVVNQGQGACVPAAQTCGVDEAWNGQVCAKVQGCAPGFVLDPASRQCAQVSKPPAEDGGVGNVDVVQWSRSTFGPDQGQGSAGLCGPLAKKPLTFGVLAGGAARLVIQTSLTFPNGLTESAVVTTTAIVEASGQPVTPGGAQEVQAAANTLVAPLRGQKARASAPQAVSTVRCMIANGAPPVPVPSTGGA